MGGLESCCSVENGAAPASASIDAVKYPVDGTLEVGEIAPRDMDRIMETGEITS